MLRLSEQLLVEREGELEAIDRGIARAAGGEGTPILIEGPPGIGKTNLLQAAVDRAEKARFEVLRARASELERELPFGIVRQLFERLVATVEPERRAKLLDGAAGLSEPIFEPTATGRPADPTFGPLHGLYWLAANLGVERPLLLAIDDIQWIDEPSLRFLEFLGPRLEGLGIVLALVFRSEAHARDQRPPEAIVEHPHLVGLRPGPLSEEGVMEVIGDRLGERADRELAARCRRLTGGVPFLLAELLVELEAGAELSDPEAVEGIAPARVGRRVVARLRRAGAEAIAVAEALAILGENVEAPLLEGMTGLDGDQLGTVVARLAELAILAPGLPASFSHPIVRQAVYEEMPHSRRAAGHALAASLLQRRGDEPEAIAVHVLLSDPLGEPSIVGVLREAAAASMARGGPATATTYLSRALQEPLEPEVRAEVELQLGIMRMAAGDPGGTENLHRAFRLAVEPRVRAEAGLHLAMALEIGSERPEALEVAREALETAAAAAPELAPNLHGAVLKMSQGSITQRRLVQEQMQELMGLVDALPTPPPILLACAAMERAIAGGAIADGMGLGRRALEADLIGELTADSPPIYLAIGSLVLGGSFEEAARWYAVALDDARRRGSERGVALASSFRAWSRIAAGDVGGAEADADAALELVPAGFVVEPVATYALAIALLEGGKLNEAQAAVARIDLARHDLDHVLFQLHHLASARVLIEAREQQRALLELEALERWEREWGACPDLWCQWRPLAALAHRALGEDDAASSRAAEAVVAAEATGCLHRIGPALRAAALTAPRTELERGLRETVARLGGRPEVRLEHAKALTDLGAALAASGHVKEAREYLRESVAASSAIGATATADRAAKALRVTGARPRSIEIIGPGSLTPAERRVAELAARGDSNQQIAEGLFVTRKTVETHLGTTYRKLGIRSRKELGKALAI